MRGDFDTAVPYPRRKRTPMRAVRHALSYFFHLVLPPDDYTAGCLLERDKGPDASSTLYGDDSVRAHRYHRESVLEDACHGNVADYRVGLLWLEGLPIIGGLNLSPSRSDAFLLRCHLVPTKAGRASRVKPTAGSAMANDPELRGPSVRGIPEGDNRE